jgi:spore germination protein
MIGGLKYLIAIAMLVFSMPAASHLPKALAYIAWWMPESWRTAPISQLDRLLFFDLKVSASGKIVERQGWPDKWHDLRIAAKKSKTPLDLTLTLFDSQTFEQLFSSADATELLLNETLSLLTQDDAAGIHLDFEIYTAIQAKTLEKYRQFVRTLSKRMRELPQPKNLSVFFPMGAESQLYDAATLKYVDQVVFQGYDAHWRNGKHAGPVAPLAGKELVTWKNAVDLGKTLGLNKERLFMSFPLYGYEWPVSSISKRSATSGEGVITTFSPIPANFLPHIQQNIQDRVIRFGANHDPVSGSSYYQYMTHQGQQMEGWFEDWWSIRKKKDFLVNEGLAGIAFFVLGYDDNQLVDYFMQIRSQKKCHSSVDSAGLLNAVQAHPCDAK